MSRLTPRVTAGLLIVVSAPGLIAFPRQTIVAALIAGGLGLAGLHRPAVAVLCALLITGAAGFRADTSTRPHHEHVKRTHTHRS